MYRLNSFSKAGSACLYSSNRVVSWLISGGIGLVIQMIKQTWKQLAPIVKRKAKLTAKQLRLVKKDFYCLCKARALRLHDLAREAVDSTTLEEPNLELTRGDLLHIQQLQHHLAFAKADKVEKLLGWECKILYLQKLHHRVTQANNFIMLADPPHIIAARDKATIYQANKWWLLEADISSKLAVLCSTIKFHKTPIGDRFITPLHNCPLTPPSTLLGIVLRWLS